MTQSIKSDRIAKLLATEDLTVRHSNTARTASFDTKSRVLTLPVYLVSDDDVHDMMTGHEVGHALWTEAEKWEKAILEDYNRDILNVVEDARIEKKIKKRYPGIVRNFIAGYKTLEDKNFFYDEEMEINEMQFLDRLNLYFKLGLASNVRFYAEEKPLVQKVADCESWKDVLKVTRAIMEFTLAQMQEEQEQEAMEDGLGTSISSDDPGDMSLEDICEELEMEGFSCPTQERFDDMAEEATNDASIPDYKRKFNKENVHGKLPKTNLDKIVIPYKRLMVDLDNAIEDTRYKDDENKEERQIYHYHYGDKSNYYSTYAQIENSFAKFRRKTAKIVNYMVKEFERKKAAAEYRKESIAKTGVLDVNKLFSYKYNDDIFLKNIIRPDGKNHGMVFLLDWSASMTSHLRPTMDQLLALVWFCKKVNVPFEVFAFTNSYGHRYDSRDSTRGKFIDGNEVCTLLNEDSFNLMQLFSTKMSAWELTKMSKMMFLFARGEQYITRSAETRFGMGSTPLNEALVCATTLVPLFKKSYNLDIVNLFVLTDGDGNSRITGVMKEGYKQEDPDWKLQTPTGENLVIEDRVTRKSYHCGDLGRSLRNQGSYNYNSSWLCIKGQEYAILNIIKETPGVNIVGIFIDAEAPKGRYNKRIHDKFMPTRNWSEMKNNHVKGRKEMRKYGFTSHKWMSYDSFYIIPAGGLYARDEELKIESGMTASQMKKMFGQHQSGKLKSKVFVNRLMEIIC